MNTFKTILEPGKKPPYSSWTFLIIPAELAAEWGKGQIPVRGTIAGTQFRGTASRGEGLLRMPVPKDLCEQVGIHSGDIIEVTIEVDTTPRPIKIPDELRDVFKDNPEVAELYDRLPPSLRRAWAVYVEKAKRLETRLQRARKAPDGIRAREYPM